MSASAGPAAKPAVTKSPQPIKQDEMMEILNQRLVVDTLKRDLKKSEEELLKLELVMIDRVQRLAKQERGPLVLGIEMKAAGTHTPWKDLFAAACGPEGVEAEMEKTRKANAENAKPKLVVMRDGQVEKTA